jgi:hypothetical protein
MELDRNAEYWDQDPDGNEIERISDKVIVETAVLALLASRIPNPPQSIQALVRELLESLAEAARTERTAVLMMRFPYTAASLGLTHVVLSSLGYRDERFDKLTKQALESGQIEAIERPPFRSMDVRWVRELATSDWHANFDDLVPHSILSTSAHPIYMNRSDAYALTHALMYVTDFGIKPPPASLDLERLAATVDAALSWNIMTEDLDLLGEMLLSVALLRHPWSPHARFAWHFLAGTWDTLGFLPGPGFEVPVYNQLEGDESTAYAFQHTYHTTYVAGVLCATLLYHPERSKSTPWTPIRVDGTPVAKHCKHVAAVAGAFCERRESNNVSLENTTILCGENTAAKETKAQADYVNSSHSGVAINSLLVRALQCPGQHAQPTWRRVLADCRLEEQEQATILSDAVLVQATRHYDLGMIAEALLDAIAFNLPPSPTFLEAAMFLARQQLPSGAIGAHFVIDENLDSPESVRITSTLAYSLARVSAYLAEPVYLREEHSMRVKAR